MVELAKFDKQPADITTDLDKLVYTMKTLHTTEPTQYPAFWKKLKQAINKLDVGQMASENPAIPLHCIQHGVWLFLTGSISYAYKTPRRLVVNPSATPESRLLPNSIRLCVH